MLREASPAAAPMAIPVTGQAPPITGGLPTEDFSSDAEGERCYQRTSEVREESTARRGWPHSFNRVLQIRDPTPSCVTVVCSPRSARRIIVQEELALGPSPRLAGRRVTPPRQGALAASPRARQYGGGGRHAACGRAATKGVRRGVRRHKVAEGCGEPEKVSGSCEVAGNVMGIARTERKLPKTPNRPIDQICKVQGHSSEISFDRQWELADAYEKLAASRTGILHTGGAPDRESVFPNAGIT
eukprot:gene5827-biopygen7057